MEENVKKRLVLSLVEMEGVLRTIITLINEKQEEKYLVAPLRYLESKIMATLNTLE